MIVTKITKLTEAGLSKSRSLNKLFLIEFENKRITAVAINNIMESAVGRKLIEIDVRIRSDVMINL